MPPQLWDVVGGKEWLTLDAHRAGVTAVHFHPVDFMLASSSVDRSVSETVAALRVAMLCTCVAYASRRKCGIWKRSRSSAASRMKFELSEARVSALAVSCVDEPSAAVFVSVCAPHRRRAVHIHC
jgi:hypothetical protein